MAEKQSHSDLSPSMQEHSCEICGAFGLSDDSMLDHTRQCHVEGSALCPFCGMAGAGAELLLHVNQAHLDYLTPENELMSFIDDQSPSVDGDSDSMSECRGLSPSITEVAGMEKINGVAHSNSNHNQMNGRNTKASTVNGHYQNGLKISSSPATSSHSKSHFNQSDLCSSSSGSSSNTKFIFMAWLWRAFIAIKRKR